MRRTFLILSFLFLGAYFLLHLVLASGPVQKRVLQEIQGALAKYGLDLSMESIEFSAFAPKIYLNRVSVAARPNSAIPLPEKITIDKIKIEFRPFRILQRKIFVEELILFHPRIPLDRGIDLAGIVESVQKISAGDTKKSAYRLHFHKFGIVDAQVRFRSTRPAIVVRTDSFTLLLTQLGIDRRSVTLESSGLAFEYENIRSQFEKIDIDVDATLRNLRINRLSLVDGPLQLLVKGVSGLPKTPGIPEEFNLSTELKVPLARVAEMFPDRLKSGSGTVEIAGGFRRSTAGYAGEGLVRFLAVSAKGYGPLQGGVRVRLAPKEVHLSDLALEVHGGGNIRGEHLSVGIDAPHELKGGIKFTHVALEQVLKGLRVKGNPVRLYTSGTATVQGKLQSPFQIHSDLDAKVEALRVLNRDDLTRPGPPPSVILEAANGTLRGALDFSPGKMDYAADIEGLGGRIQGRGMIGLGDSEVATVDTKIQGVDMGQLRRIGSLPIGGTLSGTCQVNVVGDDATVDGEIEASGLELAQLVLGNARSKVTYKADVLSFPNIEITASDPIQASGFVDFKKDSTRYRFSAETRSVDLAQVGRVFQKRKLGVQLPTGGESSARLSIRGGEEGGIEVSVSGKAKGFNWYDEPWVSGDYVLTYREDSIEVPKLVLAKKTGSVELQVEYRSPRLSIQGRSNGLAVDELRRIREQSLQGVVSGSFRIEGEAKEFPQVGTGDLKFTSMQFRGNPIPDLVLSAKKQGVENGAEKNLITLRTSDGKAQLQVTRGSSALESMRVQLRDYDFAPALSLIRGRDTPSLNALWLTGEVDLNGSLTKVQTWVGKGSLERFQLESAGVALRNTRPIAIRVRDGNFWVDRFELSGPENQFAMELDYQPGNVFKAKIDANIDLSLVQAFIPGVDSGAGKLSAGIRVSGHPDRFEMLGTARLQDGRVQLRGLRDEIRSIQAQLSISHDRLAIDSMKGKVNGSDVSMSGDVKILRFNLFSPNLAIRADRVLMNFTESLRAQLSGDFTIRGAKAPYLLSGTCKVHEALLSKFESEPARRTDGASPLGFDVNCPQAERLIVDTDTMKAEFRGDLQILGDTENLGMLGELESNQGSILFRDAKFGLTSANVKFESSEAIAPRFYVAGRTFIREQRNSNKALGATTSDPGADRGDEYEVNLVVQGTPKDYRIRLSSVPALLESDIISLLLLGVTSRSKEGNYADFGSALMGTLPLQSRLKNELGVNIRLKSQNQNDALNAPSAGSRMDPTVPRVQIQKEISNQTRVTYSNSLETSPSTELKLEQMLDENLSVNATVERFQGGGQAQQAPSQSYGLDIRYRFQFE